MSASNMYIDNHMYKVIVLGNDRSGKTRFSAKTLGLANTPTEILGYTAGYAVYVAHTDKGQEVHLFDTGRGGMRDGYFMQSNAAIIMYNKSSTKSKYRKEVRQNCGDIPIVYIKTTDVDALSFDDAKGKLELVISML
jgi:hypothetical protein